MSGANIINLFIYLICINSKMCERLNSMLFLIYYGNWWLLFSFYFPITLVALSKLQLNLEFLLDWETGALVFDSYIGALVFDS